MRTIQIDGFGGPDVLRLRDVPAPEPGPGEVLVRTVAASVNPVDAQSRTGAVRNPAWRFPVTLGRDLAGVVVTSDDDAWRPGDAVVAATAQWASGNGSWAELVAVPAVLLARAPAGLSPVEAAALPLAGTTAWQLLEAAAIRPGDRTLVVGAAGGVGALAVQLAAARGLAVDALVSRAGHVALARELGAVAAFDRPAAVPAAAYDVVLATSPVPVAGAIGPRGRYVTIAAVPADVADRDVRSVSVAEDGATLARLVGLADAGLLRPRVAGAYPVERFREAIAAAEGRGLAGKVVLTF